MDSIRLSSIREVKGMLAESGSVFATMTVLCNTICKGNAWERCSVRQALWLVLCAKLCKVNPSPYLRG